MVNLLHRVSLLPCKGKDPGVIIGKSGDLALAKFMKKNYKLEKKKRDYTISSIKDKGVYVATQFLARKVMRKRCSDEVLAPVVALSE